MNDLISRSALMEDISESVVFSVGKGTAEIRGANKIIERIKAAQTVDAVEVVRCGECRFMEKRYTPDGSFCGNYCFVWTSHNGDGDDGYCNYGERKEP